MNTTRQSELDASASRELARLIVDALQVAFAQHEMAVAEHLIDALRVLGDFYPASPDEAKPPRAPASGRREN